MQIVATPYTEIYTSIEIYRSIDEWTKTYGSFLIYAVITKAL